MAADVGGLIADIGLNVAGLRQDINVANRELSRGTNRMNRSLGRLQKGVRSVTRGFKGLVGAISVGIMIRHAREVIDNADAMLKLTQRIGGTTEAMSELEFVAERSGVQFNTLTMGLQRQVRRVAEAAEGYGEAKKALRELNLDAERLVKLPLDKQFEEIADALSHVENESDRVRLAMKLFDSEGVALLQLMKDGSKGIRELREEGRKLGVTLSQDMAEKAAQAKDAMTNLDAEWSSFTRDLTIDAVPALIAAIQALRDLKDGIKNTAEIAAGALGFGAQADELNQRIDELRKERKEIEKSLKFSSSDSFRRTFGDDRADTEIAKFKSQLESINEQLSLAKKQQVELLTGTGDNSSGSASGSSSASGSGLLGSANDDELKRFSDRFQTAEMRVAQLRAELEKFKGDLTDGQIALINEEIKEIWSGGLEEIEVTSKKRLSGIQKAGEESASGLHDAFRRSLFDGFDEGLDGMVKSFLNAVNQMLQHAIVTDFMGALFKSGSRGSVGSIISSGIGGGAGGFLKSLIPGFAQGGSFEVGGSGGTDSQLVAFMATPGERVAVATPNQQMGAGGFTLVQHIDASNSTSPVETAAMVEMAAETGANRALEKISRLRHQGRF